MPLQRLLILSALVVVSYGWQLHIFPNGERLTHRRSRENLLVVCKVADFEGTASDVSVEWYQGDSSTPIERQGKIITILKPMSKQLVFINPGIDDGGSFTCKAKIGDEEKSDTAVISFVHAAEFVNPKPEQHPVEGEEAEIECLVRGDDTLEVFWQFKGRTVDEDDTRGYQFKDKRQILVIPDYHAKRDDGVYSCNVAQFSSFETLDINVTGYSRPQITVFEGPANDLAYEGQSAQLQCQAIGKPKPTYRWFKTEKDGEEELLESDKHSVEGGLLIVQSLSEGDRGHYKCVATNEVGETNQTTELNIFLKPRIERIANETKTEGENVQIVCRFSGEGNLTAKFVHNGVDYKFDAVDADVEEAEDNELESHENSQQSSKEKEESEEEEEEATTTEEADETTTTTSVEVEEHNEDEEADEEEDEEDEDTTTTEEADRRRRKRSSGPVVTQEGNTLTLTIDDVAQDDSGIYSCVVENEAGAETRNSRLFITHPPRIVSTSDRTVRSYQTNSVKLFCVGDAVPDPKWKWTLNGDEADGIHYQIDSEGLRTELTLTTGDRDRDYGEYRCEADNGIGQAASSSFSVIKVVQPTAPQSLECTSNMYPNYGRCQVLGYNDVQEGAKPTHLKVLYALQEDVDDEFEWENDAKNVTVEYGEFEKNEVRVPSLALQSIYSVRAAAINEAGESELSEVSRLETTSAWAPGEPVITKSECGEVCTISWTTPNDHGSPITSYSLFLREYADDDEDEEGDGDKRTYLDEGTQIELPADDTEVELSQLKPITNYEVQLSAINDVGRGTSRIVDIHTTEETGTGVFTGFTTRQLVILIAVVALVLFLIVDIICYCKYRCGLIACFCLNCLNRNTSRKEKDLEGQRPESGRLLESSSR